MFWVFNYISIYSCGFNIYEGLQVEQNIFNDCMIISGICSILVSCISCCIKLMLVNNSSYYYRNKNQYQINSG